LGDVQAQGDLFVQDTVEERNVETKTRIFISYSRKDMAFVDRLEAALRARGFEPLIDRTEIYAFEDWWKRIEGLIGAADTVVFVLSPDAVGSQVALKEVAHAASLNKRFAPIVCRRVDDSSVPEALQRLNFVFFDDSARFEESADRLAEALQTDIVWIRQHTEYGEAARRWSGAGRPNGLLLQSPTLEVAEHWIGSRPRGAPAPTEQIRTFVAASRQGALAAQRLWRVVQATVVALLLAVILVLVGWINQAYLYAEARWWWTIRPFAVANIWPYALTTAAEQALKPGQTFRDCTAKTGTDYCPRMTVVAAGSFEMGSATNEPGHQGAEGPQHTVTIAAPFAVAQYAVTFDEWDTCVADGDCDPQISDSTFGRGQRPVINVSWEDAERYVAWLSQLTGKPYRLLTEAEYEYAARGGAQPQTIFPWGNTVQLNGAVMANCHGCGGQWSSQTVPVGSFPPNKFGLYDMVGNVWEWTADCEHQDYNGAPSDGSAWMTGGICNSRMLRGGSWGSDPAGIRSAERSAGPIVQRLSFLGFRVARMLNAP
jgi:formylglycine-generating enzyme required for sulfatase activity